MANKRNRQIRQVKLVFAPVTQKVGANVFSTKLLKVMTCSTLLFSDSWSPAINRWTVDRQQLFTVFALWQLFATHRYELWAIASHLITQNVPSGHTIHSILLGRSTYVEGLKFCLRDFLHQWWRWWTEPSTRRISGHGWGWVWRCDWVVAQMRPHVTQVKPPAVGLQSALCTDVPCSSWL